MVRKKESSKQRGKRKRRVNKVIQRGEREREKQRKRGNGREKQREKWVLENGVRAN